MIAEKCGISVPDRTRVLAVQADGIDDTLGMEKMFPVITLYAYDTWEEAVEQAKNNLNKIGKGHSIAVHSTNRKKMLPSRRRSPGLYATRPVPPAVAALSRTA